MSTSPLSATENALAASSLFESGAGALRAKDYQMAKILLATAEQIWDEAGQPLQAVKARVLRDSIPSERVDIVLERGKYRFSNGDVHIVDAITYDLETRERMAICIPQQGPHCGKHVTCRMDSFSKMVAAKI